VFLQFFLISCYNPLANLNIQEEEEEEEGMFKPTFAYIKSQKVFVTSRLKIRVKKNIG
jgi:hypothetical protein